MKIEGSLSISQRQAVMKLLEKKDRDKRYTKNWRPISLLNIDTKIISTAFATINLFYLLSSIQIKLCMWKIGALVKVVD